MATPRDIHVTLTADTSKFEAAVASITLQMRRVREVMTLSAQRFGRLVYDLDTFARTADQVEAIYYTRGALDARYETPAQRDAYLRVLLRCGEHHDVAVAGFLRGWVEFRGCDLEAQGPTHFTPLTWHRYLAGTKVEVSAS